MITPDSTFANPVTLPVPAKPDRVPGFNVTAGSTWRFVAQGTWRDWFIDCGPGGYRSSLFAFLNIWPAVRQAPWFALIGEDAAGNRFEIGEGTDHTFASSGVFHLFANDLPSMRWNNCGAVTLTATEVLVPPVPPPSPLPPRRVP
jgi:hypothetical protein